MKTLKWQYFTLILALFITCMNFYLFEYIYANLDVRENLFVAFSLPVIYFSLVAAILSLLFFPYLSKFLAIIIILATCVSVYFMSSYGTIIDSDMIRNAVRTDTKEASELLINLKFILFIIFLGLLPSFLILKTKIDYVNMRLHFLIKTIFVVFFLSLAVSLFYVNSKQLIPFFRTYKEVRVYNAPFYQIYSFIKFIKQELTPKPEYKVFSNDASIEKNEAKLMIFVLGETARGANYSLGNYTKNDTNFYTKTLDVAYFSDVTSCGTSTAISVPCMFSLSKKANFSQSEYQENVLDVLEKLGVKVIWLGNNSGGCQGVCNKLNFKEYYKSEFDGTLLDKFQNALKNEISNNALKQDTLIVLHLQGSHGPTYYKRYPKEFAKFTPTCDTNALEKCSQDQIYNTFDNTIFYTDFIVSEVIKTAQNQLFNTSVIYVSDHGESLGENGIYLHGLPFAIAPQTQTLVPLIAYSNQNKVNEILKENKNKATSHDAISPTLLGYFDVKFHNESFYDYKLDLFKEQK